MNFNPTSGAEPQSLSKASSVEAGGTVESVASYRSGMSSRDIQKLAESMEQLHKLLTRPEVAEALTSFAVKVVEFLAPFQPVFKAIGTIALVVGESLSRLPEYMRNAVLRLANRGWFFDPEMTLPDMAHVAKLILAGEHKEVDAFMASHFEVKIDQIEAKLISALPHRARFFKSGFAAHRREEYDLSILAFIAQSDGVSKELRGGHFFLFDRATQRPQTAPYADAAEAHVYDQIAHVALTASLAIKARISKRSANGTDALNRHAVMHGESLDYDTRVGSLQALSLLNYLALALDASEGSALATARATPFGSLLDSAGRTLRYKGDGKADISDSAAKGGTSSEGPAHYPKT